MQHSNRISQDILSSPMAPRAITPTHTGSFLSTNAAPNTPTSISPESQTAGASAGKDLSASNPRTALASAVAAKVSAGSGTFNSLNPSKRRLSPAYIPQPLTGAAAMVEERRMREQRARQRELSRQTSPNPGATAIKALLGGPNSGTSTLRDAPAATTTMSEPLAKIAKTIHIPDSASVESAQTSPVSIASFGSVDTTTAPTATAADVAPSAPINLEGLAPAEGLPSQNTPSGTVPANNGEGSSNRAYTFPVPGLIDQEARAPTRNMSLPLSGYPPSSSPRSPSTKRHKCPYCSTDFTRHHNLKSHLLTHSQEKPYECPTCQARFRRLHDLKRHTKLHTGERPHICPKCGRRFARGDALARHNKGQGGCAGRRPSTSFDDEGPEGRVGGDSMDALEYHASETAEPERMDEDEPHVSARRRGSEPTHKGHSPHQNSAQGSYHQHSSTYPPIGGNLLGNSVRAMYPPGHSPGGSGTATSSRDQSTNVSPKAPGSLGSIHFAAGQPSIFAQGSMTESPKPLSPGQTMDSHHRPGRSDTSGLPGGHPLQRQSLGHGAGRGSSPLGLPPPMSAQLPPFPGMGPSDPRTAMANKASNPSQGGKQPGHAAGPSLLNQQLPNPETSSNPGSLSSHSHGQSSGGSLRDILGGRESDLWGYVRNIEERMARMQDEYESRIGRLQDEVVSLKGQLQQQGR